jgi:hypothetical protein
LSDIQYEGGGIYTSRLSSEEDGISEISAKVNGVDIQSSVTVRFTLGEVVLIEHYYEGEVLPGKDINMVIKFVNSSDRLIPDVRIENIISDGLQDVDGSASMSGETIDVTEDPETQRRYFHVGDIQPHDGGSEYEWLQINFVLTVVDEQIEDSLYSQVQAISIHDEVISETKRIDIVMGGMPAVDGGCSCRLLRW